MQHDSKAIERKIRDILSLLRREFNVEHIGYFGSYARNDHSVSSDIDILVEFKKPIGWRFFDLKDLLEEKLGLKVDLVSKNALKTQLKDNILKEVKTIE